MTLLFTKSDSSRFAVSKMSPEIRKSIERQDGYILGPSVLSLPKIWWWSFTCPKKDSASVCTFCAFNHEYRTCQNKSSSHCSNCSILATSPDSRSHFTSSKDCLMMISQHKKVTENIDFTRSKKVVPLWCIKSRAEITKSYYKWILPLVVFIYRLPL